MKTKTTIIVSFIPAIVTALEKAGYDVDKTTRDCQSWANDSQHNVEEKAAKRGAMKGGQGWNAAGELSVKDMTANITQTEVVTWKQAVTGELIKFNDTLAAMFRKCGNPSGEVTIALFPRHIVEWLDLKQRKSPESKAATKAANVAALESKRQNTPAKGNGAHVPA